LHEPRGDSQLPPDRSDNSNTQFAILGVWAASRHGLPMDTALAHIARRFRLSQHPNGSWSYNMWSNDERPSMTGVGLLGLAVGLGLTAAPDSPRDSGQAPPRNPAVEKGLSNLALSIGNALGWKAPGRGRGRGGINLYFLWTVERVGVLFNLKEIDGKDWYRWGAELLVDSQNDDGSWSVGGYHGATPTVDTCLALLFLKRANPVHDLAKRLEFVIDIKGMKPSD
jgi:hypothetical protein